MEKRHELVHNAAEKRYEYDLGSDKAFVEYLETPDFMVLTHTEVPARYEGQGIGSELVRGVLEDVRARNKRIVPQCQFVAAYIYRHPEWEDVLLKEVPAR